MVLNTIVEHDTSGLQEVVDFLNQLDEGRFISGIRCRLNEPQMIDRMLGFVRLYQERINIESKSLTEFSESFLRQFATDNNKCFETAEVLFSKIQKTLNSISDVFKRMVDQDRRKMPEGRDVPSVYERSPLGGGPYSDDLYGLESYPQAVRDLYKGIETMFTSAASVLALCHRMIEDEAALREDVDALREIYKRSCAALLTTIDLALFLNNPAIDTFENPLENLRKETGSDESPRFLQKGYHRVDRRQLSTFSIMCAKRKASSRGLTDTEQYYWPDDVDMALRARYIIQNFDKLSEAEGLKGKMSSMTLVKFLYWCGINQEKQRQFYLKHFVPTYTGAGGRLKPLAWSAVSRERKVLLEHGQSEERLAHNFRQHIDGECFAEMPDDISKAV